MFWFVAGLVLLILQWFEQKDLLCGDPDKLSLEEQFEQKVDTVEVWTRVHLSAQMFLLCTFHPLCKTEERFAAARMRVNLSNLQVEYEQAKFLLKEKHMFDEAAVALSQLNMRIENMLKEVRVYCLEFALCGWRAE